MSVGNATLDESLLIKPKVTHLRARLNQAIVAAEIKLAQMESYGPLYNRAQKHGPARFLGDIESLLDDVYTVHSYVMTLNVQDSAYAEFNKESLHKIADLEAKVYGSPQLASGMKGLANYRRKQNVAYGSAGGGVIYVDFKPRKARLTVPDANSAAGIDINQWDIITPQDRNLYALLLAQFEKHGAFLPDEEKATIQDINQKLHTLCDQYLHNIVAGIRRHALLITDPAMLDGIPDAVRKKAASLGNATRLELQKEKKALVSGTYLSRLPADQQPAYARVLEEVRTLSATAAEQQAEKRKLEKNLDQLGTKGLKLTGRIGKILSTQTGLIGINGVENISGQIGNAIEASKADATKQIKKTTADIAATEKQLSKAYNALYRFSLHPLAHMVQALEAAHLGPSQECYIFPPARLDVEHLVCVAKRPDFQSALTRAYKAVGSEPPYDNRPVIKKIHALREKFAVMLGYKDFSEYAMEGTDAQKMATQIGKTPVTYLESMLGACMPRYVRDIEKIQQFYNSVPGNTNQSIPPHNFAYWARQAYGFDSEAFSQYLPLNGTLERMLGLMGKKLGVAFEEDTACPKHTDERIYNVYRVNRRGQRGERLPRQLCFDLYEREGKKDLAWATAVPGRAYVIHNLPRNGTESGTLLDLTQYIILFHETGHALMHCLSEHGDPRELRARVHDIEFPSMFTEAMAVNSLKDVARHHKTGKLPPAALKNTAQDYADFLHRMQVLKFLLNGWKDLTYHAYPARLNKDIDSTDYILSWPNTGELARHRAIAKYIPQYNLTNFLHMTSYTPVNPPYPACYNGYLIAAVKAANAQTAGTNKIRERFENGFSGKTGTPYTEKPGIKREMLGEDPERAGNSF